MKKAVFARSATSGKEVEVESFIDREALAAKKKNARCEGTRPDSRKGFATDVLTFFFNALRRFMHPIPLREVKPIDSR